MTDMADDNKRITSNRNSMPPDGLAPWNYGSQSMQSIRSTKPERLYKVWPGNNVCSLLIKHEFGLMFLFCQIFFSIRHFIVFI